MRWRMRAIFRYVRITFRHVFYIQTESFPWTNVRPSSLGLGFYSPAYAYPLIGIERAFSLLFIRLGAWFCCEGHTLLWGCWGLEEHYI